MEKHTSKHQPSIQDSNNNMGPFGLIRGIMLISGAIHSKVTDNRAREEHKRTMYNSDTRTYQHNCREYTLDGREVFTDYGLHGADYVQRDIHGNVIRNFTKEAECRELAELDKKYPDKITVKEYGGECIYTPNWEPKGSRVVDRKTGKLLCIRDFNHTCSHKQIYEHLNHTMFYMDPQTYFLLRPTDMTTEINLRCSNNHKAHYTQDELKNFMARYNSWIGNYYKKRSDKSFAIDGISFGQESVPREFVSGPYYGFTKMDEDVIQREVNFRKEI